MLTLVGNYIHTYLWARVREHLSVHNDRFKHKLSNGQQETITCTALLQNLNHQNKITYSVIRYSPKCMHVRTHVQTLTRYLDIVQSILVHRIRRPLPFQLEYHQPTVMTWGEGGGRGGTGQWIQRHVSLLQLLPLSRLALHSSTAHTDWPAANKLRVGCAMIHQNLSLSLRNVCTPVLKGKQTDRSGC